ncbi:hypothetical protein FHL15_010101 [Xylaria flabelliformis]|uniref:Uncharacterized protein n=1 Tax=Xylaria flabelliformis TaxID=2512241 RepID=A0A553HLZ7_9PEZI|nr:hypothetical protein FHL15_010101 [Xylaria flabelliformis]
MSPWESHWTVMQVSNFGTAAQDMLATRGWQVARLDQGPLVIRISAEFGARIRAESALRALPRAVHVDCELESWRATCRSITEAEKTRDKDKKNVCDGYSIPEVVSLYIVAVPVVWRAATRYPERSGIPIITDVLLTDLRTPLPCLPAYRDHGGVAVPDCDRPLPTYLFLFYRHTYLPVGASFVDMLAQLNRGTVSQPPIEAPKGQRHGARGVSNSCSV